MAVKLRSLGEPREALPIPNAVVELLDESARRVDREPGAGPLRVSKSLLTQLDRCEALALAPAEPSPLTHAMAVGRLVDHSVAFALTRGVVDRPSAVAMAMAEASGDDELLAVLSGSLDALTEDDQALLEEANAGAARLGTSRPRSVMALAQSSVEVPLGGRRVLLGGRFDVEFLRAGVPGSVGILEVKAGSFRDEHRADGYWYALLAALRDGVAPAWVIGWSPAAGEFDYFDAAHATAAASALVSAARRVSDAIDRLARLNGSTEPLETAVRRSGWWCGACPLRVGCPQALASAEGFGRSAAWGDEDEF